MGWVIIELNLTFLRTHLLPELAQRYFSGPEGFASEVAVIDESGGRRVIFSSDPGVENESLGPADAVIDLLGRPHGRLFRLELEGKPEREGVLGNEGP